MRKEEKRQLRKLNITYKLENLPFFNLFVNLFIIARCYFVLV